MSEPASPPPEDAAAPPGHEPDPTPPPAGATVQARGLGLRTRRGWVFDPVNLDVSASELVALTGPAGSGRTSLLLALAGRFRFNRGRLRVDDLPLPEQSRSVQRRTALGYVAGAHEPEPALTVGEHVTERLNLLGRGPAWPSRRRTRAREILAAATDPLDPAALGRDLHPYQRQQLCLTLALLAEPRLVVVDEVDVATDSVEQAALWRALRELTEAGITVVASCRETEPGVADQIVRLGHAAGTDRDDDAPDTAGRHTRTQVRA